MPNYTGINHLALVTSDMDATIRFWRDLLGMPLVAGLGRPGYRHYFFSISPTDMVAFFEWPGTEPVPEKDHGMPVKGAVAFDHIAFGVAGENDLWEIKARLEAADIWVSEAVDHGFIHSIYAFDPNGIAIEFSVQARGIDLRKCPRMTDSSPSAEALHGPAPRNGVWPAAPRYPDDERQVYPGEGEEFLHARTNAWKTPDCDESDA